MQTNIKRIITTKIKQKLKIYIRDSGILHALLGIENHNELLGHDVPEIKARCSRKKKELTAESSLKAGITTTLDRVHAAMLLH